MRLRRVQRTTEPPPPTGYVGDYADKLSRIRPIPHDEDERPCREDLEWGQTLFTHAFRLPARRRRQRDR